MAKKEKTLKKVKRDSSKKSKATATASTSVKPIDTRMSKGQINAYFVERYLEEFEGKEVNEKLLNKLVKLQMAAFEELIAAHLGKGGLGSFTMPGLFTIKAVYKPGVKGGVEKANPFKPGEMMITKDRPASVKTRIVAMKKIKDMSLEGISTHKRLAKEAAAKKAERAALKAESAEKPSKKSKKVKKDAKASKTAKAVVKKTKTAKKAKKVK